MFSEEEALHFQCLPRGSCSYNQQFFALFPTCFVILTGGYVETKARLYFGAAEQWKALMFFAQVKKHNMKNYQNET